MRLTTKHLVYEDGFVKVVKDDGTNVDCGGIQHDGLDDCLWPRSMGDEPDWFDDEIVTLINKIKDEKYRSNLADRDYRIEEANP